ncbi:S41 family peptidase [Bdellovibrio sp. HCB337]|uniref:S41 family peptidase n=1 Tax=Bdellovibrio sp. HCB337 TaxID=3394358 RepID=UPI0039A651E1
MVRTPKFIVSALLLTLAMGSYIVVGGNAQKLSKVKTAEEYWAETGLSSQALEELLQEGSCESSERYFYACVNAIQSASQKFGFDLTVQGQLVPSSKSASQTFTEKEILAPWKAYLSSQKQIPTLPFLAIWKNLSAKIKSEQQSYAVGLGMNGFLSVFRDPHTYLLPANMYTEVVAKANPKSLSIGVVVGRDDQHYFVKKVIENSSAYLAGIKKGDVILSVNDKKADGLTAQELGEMLRGEAGSILEIEIRRHSETKEIRIVRSEQTLPTVSTQMLEGITPVGVLTINKFAINACQEVRTGLSALRRQGIRGLLLDLRDNPGGQMEEATCITGLFVGPGKKVFDIKNLALDMEDESSFTTEEAEYTGPIAVLINAGSASAAEIVAGALQDYKRATLVGERTFGKGSFQEGELWAKNDKIAIFETKGFYYLPSGRSPQMTGLMPDVRVTFKDRFALREEDQFWNPLQAPIVSLAGIGISGLGLSSNLQPDLATCISFDSDFLPPEDPEMKEAHRVLNCRGIAERGAR